MAQPQRWAQFVKDSGIKNVKLDKYYLGKIKEALSDAEYEQMMTSLFADMVTCGALILPSPHNAEDFIFKMEYEEHNYQRRIDFNKNMTVAMKNEPEKTIPIFMPRWNFTMRTTMSQHIVQEIVEETSKCIKWLLNKTP